MAVIGRRLNTIRSADRIVTIEAHLALDRTWLLIAGREETLASGLAVTAEIKTGNHTVISYLLSLLRRYAHDGIRER